MIKPFTFIDLFAGIGGFHEALTDYLKGICLYASEIDVDARNIYRMNHAHYNSYLSRASMIKGDILLLENQKLIPFNADILCAGFPCQPFSLIGKQQGFKDERGSMFHILRNIIEAKLPKAIFLENVANLVSHNKGETFNEMITALHLIGYRVYHKVMNSSHYGLPQNRRRLYIVGFRKDIALKDHFAWPKPFQLQTTMSDILGGKCSRDIGFTIRCGGRGSGINDRHNWDSYEVDGKIVRLNVKNALQMMGFSTTFFFSDISETKAFKLLGNSVDVNLVRQIACKIIEIIN